MKCINFKKYVLLTLAMVMMMSFTLTGCTGKEASQTDVKPTASQTSEAPASPANADAVTIKVQLIGDFMVEDTTDKISGKTVLGVHVLKEEFEKNNPGIKVEFIPMSWDDYTQKTQAMITANECDVYQVPAIANLASQGLLEPLAPYIERDKFDTSVYFNGQMDGWMAMGPSDKELQIYGLPFIGDTRYIEYDKKIFDEWKVPYLSENPTPEEILDAAKKMTGKNPVTGKDNYGVYYKGGDVADSVMNLCEAFGGSWGTGVKWSELKYNFNSPEMLKALNFMIDLNKYAPAGSISGQGGELWGTPDNNIAINLRSTPGNAQTIASLSLTDRYAASYLFVNSQTGTGGMFAGSPFSIGRSSSHKDEAWEFLKFSASESFQKYMWENQRAQSLPVIKAALNWDSVKKEPELGVILSSVEKLWTPRYIYRSAQPRYIFSASVEEAMLGKATPEDALNKAQKDAENWSSQQSW
jgi:ABC-type glycerol-3-phosphate transport system substrate-binding protein